MRVREDQEKLISRSVISERPTEDLIKAREWISKLLEWRAAAKLYKTYIEGIKKATEYTNSDKVYCDYKLDGTVTGRLSCGSYSAEKSMGVSFHTLPRDKSNNIREIFVAPNEMAFITIDYAGMELRVLAHIAKDPRMQKAFEDGADLHTYSASLLFGKEASKITKEERQIAKATSFLIVYGGTAYTLANNNKISLKKAERIINTYMSVFPGIESYIDNTYNSIRRDKYIRSIFGRKRRLENVSSPDDKVSRRALRQGLNFTIQSAASDIILCGIKGLNAPLNDIGAKIVSTVHDSLEIICPKKNLKECLEICYNELINTPTLRKDFNINFEVPLSIDVEVGRSFGDGISAKFIEGKVANEEELLGYFNDK